MSAKFTQLDEIEVGLRYIGRLRSMQPSKSTMDDLDRQERELKHQKKRLLEDSSSGGNLTLNSEPRRDHPSRRRVGF